MLALNGFVFRAPVDEAERIILDVAAGELGRDTLRELVRAHARPE